MARIIVYSVDSFKLAVQRLANPRTHEVVTDRMTSITLVPRTTSRHRHYIQYSTRNEQEIATLLSWLTEQGYHIIEGFVQEVVA